ncbi:MAG: helix-turn-helix domain-containing protein [Gemmataceae bacterium]|nr:helix-turn-helix domain-containing protein [Gemmataceae bacterium]
MPSKKSTVSHAPIVAAFAQRLKAVRLARGMTQRQLAEAADITFSYISRLEAGGASPGIDLLERLATALRADVTDLLPPPVSAADARAHREKVRGMFEGVLSKAGPETLAMLEAFLTRLAESASSNR